MPHQPMPRTDRDPSVDDCLELSAYWEAEAARPEANGETILVALAEAKHWRNVAKELESFDWNESSDDDSFEYEANEL